MKKTALIFGLMIVGIVGLVTFVSATATCTKDGKGVCLSCKNTFLGVTLTGYNYNDAKVDGAYIGAATHTKEFKGKDDAKSKLKGWGYSSTCYGLDAPYDFTRGVNGCAKDRYQARVQDKWKYLSFNQGPEPNPCINLACGSLISIRNWHSHCYEDCINAKTCTPGNGVD